jgi:hypothetical protein
MFRTFITVVSVALAAGALAAPVALGDASSDPRGPAYSLGPGYLQYVERTGWFSPELARQREQIPSAFPTTQAQQPVTSAQGPGYSLGPGYLEYVEKTGWFSPDLVRERSQIGTGVVVHGSSFDWSAAGIGAGIGAGAVLLLAGIAATFLLRNGQNRLRTT